MISFPPGKHTITILVNNGPGSVPAGITGSHSWTENTQTNWNGIIGKLCLEAFIRIISGKSGSIRISIKKAYW